MLSMWELKLCVCGLYNLLVILMCPGRSNS